MNFLNIELRGKNGFPSHTPSITPTFRELWEHGAPHWIGTAATHWMESHFIWALHEARRFLIQDMSHHVRLDPCHRDPSQ